MIIAGMGAKDSLRQTCGKLDGLRSGTNSLTVHVYSDSGRESLVNGGSSLLRIRAWATFR